MQAPTAPSPPPDAPVQGPAQTPGEGGQVDDGPKLPPTTAASDQLKGGDGVDQTIQLSPIAPEPGAQSVAADEQVTIPAGDPREFRDVLPDGVPEGKIDAATDPQRPCRGGLQGVLVNRNDQWAATGAWTSDPTNKRLVIFTRDVHRVEYPWSSRAPSYMLVGRRGTRMPRPRSI